MPKIQLLLCSYHDRDIWPLTTYCPLFLYIHLFLCIFSLHLASSQWLILKSNTCLSFIIVFFVLLYECEQKQDDKWQKNRTHV